MYRALNGDVFFKSQLPGDLHSLMAKIASGKFPDRKKFMPHVPSRLRTLVRKALQVKPSDRFQAATEMADALSRVRLILDWSVEPIASGGFRWSAKRPGQCDLIVEMTNRNGAWDVSSFTQRTGEPRRAKRKKNNWRRGLSLDDAYSHLNDVFETLPE